MAFRLLYEFFGIPLKSIFYENGDVNRNLFDIGTEGYRFQSQILGISAKYGPFSPGPAELKAYEAAEFMLYLNQLIELVVLATPLAILAKYWGFCPDLQVGSEMLGVILFMTGVYWFGMVCDPRRRPGYDWRPVMRPRNWRRRYVKDRLREKRERVEELQTLLKENEMQVEMLWQEKLEAVEVLEEQVEDDMLTLEVSLMISSILDEVEYLVEGKNYY
ncbi:hypothetical protein F4781DRAFT_427992 [Annulohypoxylon bovei var. microspora]|nr:hypothetical protein F4781DRAFT_427992 [Annulohypoxylon bovei var. microspora]